MGKEENFGNECMINFMPTFKKTFILIVLFFAFLNAHSYSEVIKKVEVKGNERISVETIKVFGDISVGKNYEVNDVNDIIKKLYNTSFFSSVSIQLKDNVLNIENLDLDNDEDQVEDDTVLLEDESDIDPATDAGVKTPEEGEEGY